MRIVFVLGLLSIFAASCKTVTLQPIDNTVSHGLRGVLLTKVMAKPAPLNQQGQFKAFVPAKSIALAIKK